MGDASLKHNGLASPCFQRPAVTIFSTILPVPTAPSPHLILFIGLPGSGKSTAATHLLKQCPQRRLIATDAIRAQLFGNEATQGSWMKVWRAVDSQLRQTAQHIMAGSVWEAMYDATNVVRKQRRDAIALAHHAGFTTITGLWFNTPLATCLERNQHRDRQVPSNVILDMYRHLTGAPPSLAEGFDRLIVIQGKG